MVSLTDNKLTDRKQINFLGGLCSLVYFASYLTRMNFATVISEVITAEGITKSTASIVTTASFISYGLGQLISGYLGDRINPSKLIFFGLMLTTAMNVCIPICPNAYAMAAVWFVNGFAQAMLWPPIIKILASHLHSEDYRKKTVSVTVGGLAGTILIYLIAPVCIRLWQWRAVFFCTAAVSAVVAVVWLINSKKFSYSTVNSAATSDSANAATEVVPFKKLFLASGLGLIIIGILFQGLLKDGVTTWIPSFIAENYGVENSISILSSVVIPIFGILSIKVASFVKNRFFENELTCASAMFTIGVVSSLGLLILFKFGAVPALIIAALLSGSMHGVNIMLISLVPKKFERYGNVAFVSGLLNFFTYVGSAMSTYVIAKISEGFGWNATILSWAIFAALGLTACLLCIRQWRKFTQK